jgi:4-aminobutyrate aminotransferase-like enzyme
MSSFKFSMEPVKVPKIETPNRVIKTPIPCKGTKEVLKVLDKYESRSMHGQLPLVWDSAKDCSIYDADGNKWIDFTSAIFFANVGHSNERVSSYISQSIGDSPLIGCYAYGNKKRADYFEKLIKFAGSNFEKAFLMSAGTEATEAALKLMRMYGQKLGKKKLGIIAFENNWHGRTMGAQMMSGNIQQKEWIGNLDPDIHHLPFPYPWKVQNGEGKDFFRKSIEDFVSNGLNPKTDICGVIMETFQGWGAIFYPKDFVKAADEFCKENNILLAFDEMQSGFARTGKAFGYQHYNVSPDLLCCGKGMGNGYPISGVIGKADVMDLPEIGNMSSTHSANPMACATGMAVLEEIESKNLIKESERKGNILLNRLNLIKNKSKGNVSDVFGKGLIAALVFKDPVTKTPSSKLASRIAEKCLHKGLLVVHTGRESIKIGPPLTITDDALNEGIDIIEEPIIENIK